MSKLTKSASCLYEVGLSHLEALHKDTASEKKALLSACRDADKWASLCAESSALYESTLRTEYPSAAWKKLLKVDKQVCRLTSRLLINARRFGWTPLARSILRQRAAMLMVTDEDDPLEVNLAENEKMMKQPEMEVDPMEEVLSAYESTGNGQETCV